MEQLELLSRICNNMDSHLNKSMELLEKSEGRIDRTNAAVISLLESVRDLKDFATFLTKQYVSHIETLSQRCDNLIFENTKFMELHLKDREVIDNLHERIDGVMTKDYDKLVGVLNSLVNRPHINVDNKQL